MIIEKIPRDELERMAREAYAREHPQPVRVPRGRNVGPALTMLDDQRLTIEYRGRRYELLPVGVADGIRLADVRSTIEGLSGQLSTKENARTYLAGTKAIIALARKYLRPLRPIPRLLWRLGVRPNPFRGATEREVSQLLGFFLGCRMMSRVRYPGT